MPTAGETWYAKTDKQWNVLKREQYTYPFAENSVVRYIDVKDSRDLESLLTYIGTLATVTNPVTQGNAVSGTWRNKGCGYTLVNPNTPLQTIRIWNELVPLADQPTVERWLVTENNCTFKVSVQNYYRRTTITAPDAGTSGVTYSVVNQARDPASGYWNYTVEKREQITTYVASHKIADSQFATVYEQKFLGVRTDDKNDAGTVIAALWVVDTTVQGTSITEIRSKNANCTVDITQTKTVAKSSEAVVERTRTAFGDVVSITLRNQPTAVNDYVVVAGGIIFTRSSKKNDDNTFDNTETQRIARESTASVEASQTAFSSRASITVKNQPNAVAAPVAVSGGIITIQSYVKNEDGTFNNTQTLITAIESLNASIESYRTAFEQGITITHRNQAVAVSAVVDVANGVITRRSYKQNEDKTFDNTESLTTALSVNEVIVERYETTFETGATITNLNQVAPVNAFVGVVNGITIRRSSKQNSNGRFDNTETTTTAKTVENAVVVRSGDISGTSVSVKTSNAVAAPTDTAGYMGVGLPIKTVTAVLKDNGRFEDEVNTRTPLAFTYFTFTTKMATTSGGLDVYHVHFWNASQGNIDTILALHPYGYQPHPSISVNPHGLYDGSFVFISDIGSGGGNDSYSSFNHAGLVEFNYEFVRIGNLTYKRTYAITYTAKRDWGISTGYSEYAGALHPGSYFKELSKDWYFYKKITNISVIDTAQTLPLNITIS